MKRKGIAAFCLVFAFLPMAASMRANSGTVSVTLNPSSVSVPVGGAQTFTATVSGTSSAAVTWSIAEGVQGGSISYGVSWSEGIYSPPSSTGTFHVVATSQADPSVRATAVVRVTPALTFKVLHAFSGPDGSNPLAKLIQGSDNDFYGTTVSGGANRLGAIFKVDSSGNLTLLHSFNGYDGMWPRSGLIQGRDGNFYGVTEASGGGGYGTIFRIDSSGNFKNLHFFSPSEGAEPYSGLTQAADGYFYGTAGRGGAYGCGTVIRADTSGNVQVLHSFSYSPPAKLTDGCAPWFAGVIQASDGNFYGTTSGGGRNSQGTVLKMDSGGRVTILHAFNFSDGSRPMAPLIQGKDGFLYGTATGGPRSGGGEVFKIDLAGNFSIVHAFAGPDGLQPDTGLLEGSDGNFYGITSTGVIYRMDAQGNVTVLHRFVYYPNPQGGLYPQGGIVQGSDGNLYGVTQGGGGNQLGGVIYSVSLIQRASLAPPGGCSGAYDLGYSLRDGEQLYKVEGIGPPGPYRVHIFLDANGSQVFKKQLLQKLVPGAWTKEMILDRYKPANGSLQVEGMIADFSSVEGWEDAVDILARTTVESLAAVVTRGASVETMETRLTWGEAKRQLADPQVELAVWVHAGLEQSLADYLSMEQLMRSVGPTQFDISTLEKIRTLYMQANELASVYEALGGAIVPTTWQDVFAQYLGSALDELWGQPGLIPTAPMRITDVLNLEGIVGGAAQAFNAFKRSLDLALGLEATYQDEMNRWIGAAETPCSQLSGTRSNPQP